MIRPLINRVYTKNTFSERKTIERFIYLFVKKERKWRYEALKDKKNKGEKKKKENALNKL